MKKSGQVQKLETWINHFTDSSSLHFLLCFNWRRCHETQKIKFDFNMLRYQPSNIFMIFLFCIFDSELKVFKPFWAEPLSCAYSVRKPDTISENRGYNTDMDKRKITRI